MNGWKGALLLGIGYAVVISWGLELSINRVFGDVFGSGIKYYVASLWGITVLRLLLMGVFLKWLNLNWADLWGGELSFRELGLAFLCASFLLLPIDVPALLMKAYHPQILGEYRYFLKLASGDKAMAMFAFFSQYVYYLVEALSVNMLYLGSAKFVGEKGAIVIPMVFWGAMHILQALNRPLPVATAVAILASVEAGVMYGYAYKTGNMIGPLIIFFTVVMFVV